ncbi:MAG: PKD domain-containing protein [Planctomycetota bacterium]
MASGDEGGAAGKGIFDSASPGVKLPAWSAVIGFSCGILLTLLLAEDEGAIEAPRIQAVSTSDGGSVHKALNGRPAVCKAVLSPRPGRRLEYRWEFGDESAPVAGLVTDPYAVWTAHAYPESKAGTRFTATLTVTDMMSRERAIGTYEIEIVEPTLENRTTVALDDGLWSLHSQMVREDHPVHGPIGYWNETKNPIGSTAMAALAFEVNGYDGRAERERTPYRETVDRALAYLLSRFETVELEPQPAGDPDSNGNGLGIKVAENSHQMYEVSLAAMALAASQDPDRPAPCGPDHIFGRSLKDVVTDLADFIAFAQTDGDNPEQRGGWRYRANVDDADMSVTQWPVLALMSAKRGFGIETPEWVRTELSAYFLQHVQSEEGGFGYKDAGDKVTTRLTGAGLIALDFLGVKAADDRVRRATEFIAANWDTDNIGDFYSMYGIMKGAKLADPEITRFGDHEWQKEYAEALSASQNEDGSWSDGGSYAPESLKTALPALVLSKDVFFATRPTSVLWKMLISVGTAVLVVVLGTVVFLFFLKK